MNTSIIVAFILIIFFVTVFVMTKNIMSVTKERDSLTKKLRDLTLNLKKIRNELEEQEIKVKVERAHVGQKTSSIFIKLKDVISSLELEHVVESSIELLKKFIGAQKVQLFLTDESGKLFLYKEGGEIELVDRGDVEIGEKSMIGYCAEKRIPLFINELRNEQSLTAIVDGGKYKTIMCAPIVHRNLDKLIGVINIEKMEKDYTQDDRNLFMLVTSVTEMAVSNVQSYDQVKMEGFKLREEKEEIKKIASKYVSEKVMDNILRDPGKGQLGGKSAHITILASDIRSFSKMSENYSAQIVVEVLNDYFTIMGQIIEEYGGYLDKFIGDAIMVLFGVPERIGTEEKNSVMAALAMQEASKDFEEMCKEKYGEDFSFKVGIGISSGEAIVGNIGSLIKMDYTAIGDVVNVAFRLQSQCPGHKIYVTDTICSIVKDEFEMKYLGEMKVKGKEELVKTYEVIKSKTQWN